MLEITIRGLVAVFWLACLVQNWWRSIKASFTLCGLIQHWTAALSLRPCGAKIMSKLVVTIDVWSSQAGVNIGNDIVFWNGEIIVENERSKNVNKISRIFYWFFLNLKHVNFLWKTRKKRKKKGKHHSGFFTFVRICDLSSFLGKSSFVASLSYHGRPYCCILIHHCQSCWSRHHVQVGYKRCLVDFINNGMKST